MLVALDGHQNFSAIEALLDWRRAVRLRLVPLGIVLRRPVNIVLRVIAIGDVDLLIRLHTQDVRSVMATILIELDRGCWLHLTGTRISARLKLFSIGGAPFGCDWFHSQPNG